MDRLALLRALADIACIAAMLKSNLGVDGRYSAAQADARGLREAVDEEDVDAVDCTCACENGRDVEEDNDDMERRTSVGCRAAGGRREESVSGAQGRACSPR